MSAYHEWFMAGADKITAKKPAETVQKASNSFFAEPTVLPAPVTTDSAFTITFDVQTAPAATVDGLPDLHTADLYTEIWHHWLTADELATVRSRYPAMTLEARQDGDLFKICATYRTGAELWTAPSGRRYIVA